MLPWRPYGPDGLFFEFAEQADEAAFLRSRALTAELERDPPEGLVECVFGFGTLLLIFDARCRAGLPARGPELARRLAHAPEVTLPSPGVKSVPVIYDGPDLARVAELHALTPTEVIARHVAPSYRVHLLGFAPGFPYLGGLDPLLHTPRLATPRPRVPAGSVAIGGEHTGIYPVSSPGGWNLIGRTSVRLFDPTRSTDPAQRDPASLFFLQPGDLVKFVEAQP